MIIINRFALVVLCLFTQLAIANGKASTPYLKILNMDSQIDRMPLLLTTVDANITGLIAQVKITQYFKNDGTVPLEAQYVFPGSKQAAVHQVTMKVGDRILEAEIQEKKQARATYQKAKQEGKTTSLLEQKDPGLFTMMVANILPMDEIKVELVYTEKLIPDNGKYKFTYPAIGIPSVLNNKKGQAHIKNDEAMGFDMVVKINSPIAINDIDSINHKVDIEYDSEKQVTLLLDINESLNFKDDFIIEYSLQGNQINTGILVYDDKETNQSYFLMMVEPPKQIKPEDLIPREYIFVVDSSGSMSGAPLQMAKEVANTLLSELKEHELFNVALFAGGSVLLSESSISPTESNLEKANTMVNVSSAGGGTNLLSVIERVNQLPVTKNVSRSLIVLTDGAIDVSHATLDLIRKYNHQQNIFVIGVSNGGNDLPAIEALSRAGNGQEFIVTDRTQLESIQNEFLEYVRYPLLIDINVDPIGFNELDLQPKNLPDLFSKRPLFITGKFSTGNNGSLQLSGTGGNKTFENIFDLARFPSSDKNKSIKYLWAKEKVLALGDGYLFKTDETADSIAQITKIGLDYNLLTSYTSFVAVDNRVRNEVESLKVGNSPSTYNYAPSISSGYGYIEDVNIKLLHKKMPQFNASMSESTNILAKSSAHANQVTNKLSDQNNRKSITFILGKDLNTVNQYYRTANELFQENQEYQTDVLVTHLTTISEVKNYLSENQNSTPWGIVNIVTHSSPWSGLSVKLNASDNQVLDVYNLNMTINNKTFMPLSDAIVDNKTEFRMLGCALGKQTQLLNLVSQYFGGNDSSRPIIKSPYDFVYMTTKDQKIKTFKMGFALINPKYQYSYKDLQSALALKNINLSIKEIDNWNQQPFQISTTIRNVNYLSRLTDIKLAKTQKNFEVYLDDIGGQWSDFEWSSKTINNSVVITGKALLMVEKVKISHSDSFTLMDLDDKSLTAIIYPN